MQGFVAFSAVRMTDILPVIEDTEVTFDHIETNVGGGFDESTSHFVAPVSGYYYFAFSLNPEGHFASLHLNGVNKVSIAAGIGADIWDTASNSIILQLEVGDSVRIVVRYDASFTNDIHCNGGRYCTFSGHLLHQTV